MTKYVLGIDIAKKKFDVALLLDDNYVMATFTNNKKGYARLAKWLGKQEAGQVHACLEATGRYGEDLALFLHKAGHHVSIVNPARINAYARSQLQRNKTDREDAKIIAHFCLTQAPDLWSPPPVEQSQLRAMSRHLNALKKMRTQELNRLQAGTLCQPVAKALQAHIAFLDCQIQEMTNQIQALIDTYTMLHAERNLIESIPGFGTLSAAKFLAEVPDLSTFRSAAQLAAYAGLTPQRRESGSSLHKPAHISKTGNVHLRTLLYFPALVALKHNPIIKAMAERLRARGKRPMVIVVAAMRKLLHLVYGVLKSHTPFDPHYLQNTQLCS